MEGLLDVLAQLFPLAEGTSKLPLDTVPPPRMAMTKSSEEESMDPLVQDAVYHLATLKCNKRITADDWYQDVRHFQFSFEEDIQYVLLTLSYAKSHIIPGTLPGMLQLSILYSHMMMSKSFCRPWVGEI